MSAQMQKKKAIDLIRQGLDLYLGRTASLLGKYDTSNIHTISDLEVNAGVVALLLTTGINHGSAGDVDLYKLNQRYLQDQDFRQQINVLL